MIEVENLSKHFGKIRAVDGVSFHLEKGEVLGLLGPNGAGKSTTMKMICGFLRPTSGDSRINGKSVLQTPIEVKRMVGYLPENAPLYDDLMVEEFLVYVAKLRGMTKSEIGKRLELAMGMCSVSEVRNQKIETLSKGYKRRVGLAQALIHDPEVLILDEPTDGLDPNQKFEVRNLINDLSKDKCIIVSTHILEELEAVCTRALIISKGRKCFDGRPADLKEKSSQGRIDDVFRAMTMEVDVERSDLMNRSTIKAIIKREFMAYFQSPLGYGLSHHFSLLLLGK